MNTSVPIAVLATAHILLPPGPLFSKIGVPRILRVFIWKQSISQLELASFLAKHGFGPNGRTERYDGTREDGVIELERTVPNVRTHNELLQEACVFADEMEKHFSCIEEVAVH